MRDEADIKRREEEADKAKGPIDKARR